MLLGLEIFVGAYVFGKIIEYKHSVKEEQKKIKSDTNQIEKFERDSADAVDRKNEKETNHYLKISSVSLIISPIRIFHPSIKIVNFCVICYGSLPIVKQAGNSVKEKNLNNDILNALIVIGCIFTGNFFVAALAMSLFHLGSKVVAKIRNHSEMMLTDVFDQPCENVWIIKDGVEVE
ncbi:cation-transporting ATPase, partial [Candidatus Magnetomorum sp. HK-1]